MEIVRSIFDAQALVVQESLFHVANGYLGIRGCFEEGYAQDVPTVRGCYINAFYDDVDIAYGEKLFGFPDKAQRMLNLPDIQSLELSFEGEPFSLFTGEIKAYKRILNTVQGVYTREVEWVSPQGRHLQITFTRMASFVEKELFLTRCTIKNLGQATAVAATATINCDVYNFTDEKDPRVASEKIRHIVYEGAQLMPEAGVALCRTAKSGLQLAVAQKLVVAGSDALYTEAACGVTGEVAATLPQGGQIVLDKYIVLSDSRRAENPAKHAQQALRRCVQTGAPQLFASQQAYVAGFWQTAAANVKGDADISEGLTFSLYGLLQSAGTDGVSNICAKGLSGEGYEGHYFWDTEIYILPFFILTQPEMARRLLTYRYTILDAARQHARIMGHSKGALYPWRTITGSECSSYFPSGSAQYHINADVAHSFLDYYDVSGDLQFMAEKGAAVLVETARLWIDAGCYCDGKFHINRVTGPDEYSCIVNNNYYTNAAAKNNLLGAVRVWNDLTAAGLQQQALLETGVTLEELAAFVAAAESMYLPYDKQLGICAQDDGFLQLEKWDFANTPKENHPLLMHYHPLALYRKQVLKQADTVLAHYLFGKQVPLDVKKRTYDYYEPLTTHDSSLSKCIYGIVACELGDVDKAYEYYLDTARTDLDNTHANTKDGIHAANMGGSYLGLVAGFAGLRISSTGPSFRFCLPRQWQGYSFSIRWRQSTLQVEVSPQGASLLVANGPAVPVTVGAVTYEIGSVAQLVPLAE